MSLKLVCGICLFVIFLGVFIYKPSKCASNDAIWETSQKSLTFPYIGKSFRMSGYIEMTDGIQIAYDLYLPDELQLVPTDKLSPLPTFLHMTRYNRLATVNFPFSLFIGSTINTRSGPYLKELTFRGFAVITMDVRGTGASTGTRPIDLSPREIEDFVEVLEWVRNQPWCDKNRISSGGISYDGMTALELAAAAPKGTIQNVALIMAPVDLYDDLCFVGGLRTDGFLNDYGSFVSSVERGKVPGLLSASKFPRLIRFFLNYVITRMAPVNDDLKTLEKAINDHEKNWDMPSKEANYKDDIMVVDENGKELRIQDFGVSYTKVRKLAENNVNLRIYSGYFDHASVRGGERIFNEYNSVKKLSNGIITSQAEQIIGPWTHGVRQSCSFWSNGSKDGNYAPCFDLFKDVANFFSGEIDYDNERSVHYYTMSEEKWHHDSTWPPKNVEDRKYYLSSNNELLPEIIQEKKETIKTTVNYKAKTTEKSRWNLVWAALRQPVLYSLDGFQGNQGLVFSSSIIESDFTVSGSIVLSVNLKVTTDDASIHVYIEEITSDDDFRVYVTEGAVLASHRCVSNPKEELKLRTSDEIKWCARSFLKKDQKSLKDQEETVVIVMEPVSYRFKEGNRINLRMVGSDLANFRVPDGMPEEWEISIGESFISLPVMIPQSCSNEV